MPDILATLFGTGEKARVMRFFVLNPGKSFLLTEVRDKTRLATPDTRKNITLLTKIDLVKVNTRDGKKRFMLNDQFMYYQELRNLFIKSNTYPHCSEVQNMKSLGRVTLVAISGVFMNYAHAELDLLIVGDRIKRPTLNEKIARIEAEIGHEVRYSKMTTEDFLYRLEMMDRFLIDFLTGPHDAILNTIPESTQFLSALQKKHS